MRLSRTDLVPLLTIMAGGVIGISLSLSFLVLSPVGDVPALNLAPVPPVAPLESTTRDAPQAGTVAGEITDGQTGGLVSAAQVYITSLSLGALSRQNGRFLLLSVPTGTHTLSVTRIGYRTTQVQITVAANQTVEQDFAISEDTAFPYRFAPTERPVPTAAEITQRREELLLRLREDANN